MVRREGRGDVADRALRGPSRRSIGLRARRTPRSRRLIPWAWAFGPSPIRVQESRARSQTTRSTLIWEIPGQAWPSMGGSCQNPFFEESSRATDELAGRATSLPRQTARPDLAEVRRRLSDV